MRSASDRVTGELCVDAVARAVTFRVPDGQEVQFTNVRSVTVGASGSDFANTWVQVHCDVNGQGMAVYLNDVRWLGWRPILTGANTRLADALAQLRRGNLTLLALARETPAVPRSPTALQASADRIRWYHRMDLGSGVRTNGVYEPSLTLARLGLPSRLDGMRVLDVGVWTATSRSRWSGAARTCWPPIRIAGMATAGVPRTGSCSHATRCRRRCATLDIDPTELSPDAVGGTYDVVLFLGVLYHLRDPMGVLDRLRSVTAGLLVVETEMAMLLLLSTGRRVLPRGGVQQRSDELVGAEHGRRNRDAARRGLLGGRRGMAPSLAGTSGAVDATHVPTPTSPSAKRSAPIGTSFMPGRRTVRRVVRRNAGRARGVTADTTRR